MKKISNSVNLVVIFFIIILSLFISTFSKVSYACDDVSGATTISSDCSSTFSITGSNADITLSATASAYFRQKISMDISSSNNLMINIFYDRMDRQNRGYDQKVGAGLKYNF
jgi:hypothetical protein